MANYIDAVTFHEYTYSEENVEQKVRALRGLCKMHGVELDIIQGESGSRSKPYGHGAVYEIPFKEKDSHGTSYFKYLPVKDYPMFLVFGDIDVI